MAAVGQQLEVQRLNAGGFDQAGQRIMGGHRDVHGNAAGEQLVELFGGAEGVIVDPNTGVFLEVDQHLGGDVVVPVVDADAVLGARQ